MQLRTALQQIQDHLLHDEEQRGEEEGYTDEGEEEEEEEEEVEVWDEAWDSGFAPRSVEATKERPPFTRTLSSDVSLVQQANSAPKVAGRRLSVALMSLGGTGMGAALQTIHGSPAPTRSKAVQKQPPTNSNNNTGSAKQLTPMAIKDRPAKQTNRSKHDSSRYNQRHGYPLSTVTACQRSMPNEECIMSNASR